MQKWILRGTAALVVSVFVCYWASTLLYVMPNNYVRIQHDDYLGKFETLFFQRWGFFAPPPKTNTRLYYTFVNAGDTTQSYTFEAIQPITEQKRLKSPFNTKEEVLDYILGGSAHNIRDMLVEQGKVSRLVYPDSTDTFHLENTWDLVNQLGSNLPSYQTLVNYAAIIARKQGLDPATYTAQIAIAEEDIKPFSKRNEPQEEGLIPVQKLVFETASFAIN